MLQAFGKACCSCCKLLRKALLCAACSSLLQRAALSADALQRPLARCWFASAGRDGDGSCRSRPAAVVTAKEC
jgi:hypothetical protein